MILKLNLNIFVQKKTLPALFFFVEKTHCRFPFVSVTFQIFNFPKIAIISKRSFKKKLFKDDGYIILRRFFPLPPHFLLRHFRHPQHTPVLFSCLLKKN